MQMLKYSLFLYLFLGFWSCFFGSSIILHGLPCGCLHLRALPTQGKVNASAGGGPGMHLDRQALCRQHPVECLGTEYFFSLPLDFGTDHPAYRHLQKTEPDVRIILRFCISTIYNIQLPPSNLQKETHQ